MNIINQIDFINQKVRESYCDHTGGLTPLDSHATKIHEFSNPVTCDDCGKIIECEHDEVEHTELPYCTLCGDIIFDEEDYYGYR